MTLDLYPPTPLLRQDSSPSPWNSWIATQSLLSSQNETQSYTSHGTYASCTALSHTSWPSTNVATIPLASTSMPNLNQVDPTIGLSPLKRPSALQYLTETLSYPDCSSLMTSESRPTLSAINSNDKKSHTAKEDSKTTIDAPGPTNSRQRLYKLAFEQHEPCNGSGRSGNHRREPHSRVPFSVPPNQVWRARKSSTTGDVGGNVGQAGGDVTHSPLFSPFTSYELQLTTSASRFHTVGGR
ncbi:hypothetical protein EDB89DRAFT_1903382 [Lactarius sanguifluus]|nr:hypothetical protein EDB89DRAFT_1903382 [Lactarius sanguifluus]